MVLKKRVNLSSGLLIALGLGLLLLGFFLLIPQERRSSVAWLDLAVCAAIFLVNFSNLPMISVKQERFNDEIPKLGVLWTAHTIYTFLALGMIWRGWVLGLSFQLQLFFHLVLLFGMLVLASIATRASQHAGRVAVSEQRLSGSLDTLRSAAGDCESAFSRLGAGSTREFSQFQGIKDSVRYLSPCDNPEAVSLDLEMACLLQDLSAAISKANQWDGKDFNVNEALTRCEALMRLRKQLRTEYGYK